MTINYEISVPAFIGAKLAPSLPAKLSKAPSAFLDKLHPEKGEASPYVEYVDEGVWKTRISFQKDPSYSVLRAKINAQVAKPHASLEALCEAEVKRRFPAGTLKPQEEVKFKRQVAYSAIDRDNLICSPKIEDPELRKQLHLSDDSVLQTEHVFSKNSPVNGQSFICDGKVVALSQAICSPSDRQSPNTTNLRVVQTKNKESICYAGRPETERKAVEQASFIFLNELKTKGKGITKTVDENGKTVYRLDYVVNSTLSMPWIWSKKSIISPFPERAVVESERQVFLDLRQKGPITIEDPNCPGMKYQVHFNPILFSRSSDIFAKISEWLPPFFTGHSRSGEISEEGLNQLKAVADAKIPHLPAERIQSICTCIQRLEENLQKYNLLPEEEWLVRDYLCKLLEIPCVYHCKSSTDRTGIAVAISSALKQWIDLKLPLPANLCELLKDARFKELFAANWMTGHQITRYSRGAEGTVAGQTFNNKNLGYTLSRGVIQNPLITRLLPERYLKDFPMAETIKYSAIYMALLLPLTILFYLPMTLIAAGRHIAYFATGGKNRHWIGPAKFALPSLPFTLLLDFPTIFPKKLLNEDSPLVGKRLIIAGGKHGGKEDKEDNEG
jgi:hypothetical protein